MTKIGFIGSGKMATALAGGIANSHHRKKVPSQELTFYVSDPSPDAVKEFSQTVVGNSAQASVVPLDSNVNVFAESEIIFLAVKPQKFEEAIQHSELSQLFESNSDREQKLVVSIVAGMPISRIVESTTITNVIRTMPNTPCLIGEGSIGMACSQSVSPEQQQLVIELLESTGTVVSLDESLLDVVTGLSGSGPGYVFQFIEALTIGGVENGLPRDIAQKLAMQTVFGAAKLALETGDEPVELRNRVTSPNGTTLAGLDSLESGGFTQLVASAVKSATERSKELSAP